MKVEQELPSELAHLFKATLRKLALGFCGGSFQLRLAPLQVGGSTLPLGFASLALRFPLAGFGPRRFASGTPRLNGRNRGSSDQDSREQRAGRDRRAVPAQELAHPVWDASPARLDTPAVQ